MIKSDLRVLIVEDDILTQAGIQAYLFRQGMEIQTATNTTDTLHKFTEWQPQVIVLDIVIPVQEGEEADLHQGNGIQVARQIKKQRPETGIVFFSSHPYFRPEVLDLANKYGGLVYLLKGANHPDALCQAIEQAYKGQIVFDPQVSRGQMQKPTDISLSLTDQERERVEYALRQMGELTERELEVAHWVAASRTVAGIAKELGITPNSVQSVMGQIYSKIGLVDSEAEMLLSKRTLLVKAYNLYRSQDIDGAE